MCGRSNSIGKEPARLNDHRRAKEETKKGQRNAAADRPSVRTLRDAVDMNELVHLRNRGPMQVAWAPAFFWRGAGRSRKLAVLCVPPTKPSVSILAYTLQFSG